MIEVVSATRLDEGGFWQRSPLGRSLKRLECDSRLVPRIAFNNTSSLPDVYNARISSSNPNEIVVFVHDDVWIGDHFLADRVIEGLVSYDVIGVAGNRRRLPAQPCWCFLTAKFDWDDALNLSGAVGHGESAFGPVSFYGPAPAECELLDGVLLAARVATLRTSNVLFDPRFRFHLYDVDFCRRARQQALRLGTWPICITHRSGGQFGSPDWTAGYRDYLAKWGE
jgi:GT2 family glycosyltransferase